MQTNLSLMSSASWATWDLMASVTTQLGEAATLAFIEMLDAIEKWTSSIIGKHWLPPRTHP